MTRWPLSWRQWTALAIILVLSIAATIGLHSIIGDWSFIVPAVLGAGSAGAAFVAARRWNLLPGETLALALGAFIVIGTLSVAIVDRSFPTLSTVGDFFDGLIRSWADLLSAASPADLTPRLSVAPFAIAWFGAVVGCALLRWSPLPAAPVIGPLAGLAITVLMTDEERGLSILVGATIAVGALLLGLLLDPRRAAIEGSIDGDPELTDSMETTTSVSPHARSIRAALVIAAVAILAPLLGPRLPLADANERYDLRDQVTPPWDPLSLPSPLVQLKASLAAEVEDDVVFEVTSEEPLTRWSTSVMTSYDGIVWTVADPDDAASDFRPVSSRLPEPDVQPVSDPEVSATVTIGGLQGPWLPMPGVAREVTFADPADPADTADEADADVPAPALVENLESSTLAVPSGVADGMTYTVRALQPPDLDDDELRSRTLDVVAPDVDLEALPPQIRNLAADVTEGIDHGWGQVTAIRDLFRNEGFYDKTTRVAPGHSYYRLAQFLSEPDQIVGYEEQYAAAAGLIARIAELPVRVVVGYEIEPERYVDGTAEVRSGDASAWIEVRVDDVGWVPVSVSPPRSREPDAQTSVASEDQVATPNPPPPPQVPPDVDVFTENEELEEPVEEEEDDEEDEQVAADGGIGLVGWTAIGVGGLLLVVLAACGAIVFWKRRRTRRRREAPDPSARIAGAWLELTDRYEEAGLTTPDRSTPLEAVRSLAATDPSAASSELQLVGLARQVDRAAYDRASPPPEAAVEAWRYSDEAVDTLLANQSLPRRTRMRVDPRTLMRRDPLLRSGSTASTNTASTNGTGTPDRSATEEPVEVTP